MLNHTGLVATLPALVALASSSAPAPGQEISLALSEDAELSITLLLQNEHAATGGSMSVGDREEPFPSGAEALIQETVRLVAVDRFPQGARDATAEVIREYGTLERELRFQIDEGDGNEQDESLRIESQLSDEAVRFFVEDDERVCAPAPESPDLDDDLLEALDVDCAGWCLLTEVPTDKGANWELSSDTIRRLLLPGGRVPLDLTDWDALDDAEELDAESVCFTSCLGITDALDELDCEVSAVYAGIEDGLATVSFSGSIEGRGDLTERAARTFDLLEISPWAELESHVLECKIELEGTWVWDVRSGHLASLTWTADSQSVLQNDGTTTMMGGEDEVEIVMEFEGQSELTLVVES